MAYTPLPTPPTTADPVNFDARADAFLAALPAFGTEMNANANLASESSFNAGVYASAAAASASAAAASSNAAVWSVGTAYVAGSSTVGAAVSAVNFQVYRCTVNVTGGSDPANDTTGTWTPAGGGAPFNVVTVTTSITMSPGFKYRMTASCNPLLPATGVIGEVIGPIRKTSGSVALNIMRNGNTINGVADDVSIDFTNRDFFFVRNAAGAFDMCLA